MKKFLLVVLLIGIAFPIQAQRNSASPKEKVNERLEAWHLAAANAHYDAYFENMAENSVFIGTDPTENWTKSEFMIWAKPYFDRGKAWSFSTLERNIFVGENGNLAWFDELLETQMGICRGSGVVVKEDDKWKVKHYVLSIAIPNENVDQVTVLKKEFDNKLMSKLKSD